MIFINLKKPLINLSGFFCKEKIMRKWMKKVIKSSFLKPHYKACYNLIKNYSFNKKDRKDLLLTLKSKEIMADMCKNEVVFFGDGKERYRAIKRVKDLIKEHEKTNIGVLPLDAKNKSEFMFFFCEEDYERIEEGEFTFYTKWIPNRNVLDILLKGLNYKHTFFEENSIMYGEIEKKGDIKTSKEIINASIETNEIGNYIYNNLEFEYLEELLKTLI